MKKTTVRRSAWLFGTVLAGAIGTPLTHAADPSPSIIGKNDWLFYRYELSDASDQPATNTSIDLIRRFNQVLAQNGVAMAVTLVPLKARIHAEHLPADVKISDYVAGNYDRMTNALRAGQVNAIDLNGPFLASPKRTSDTPLFIRLDTHWAPAGSMLAAETIRAGIDANPALKKALEAAPEEKFNMSWDKRRVNSKSRDLVEQLPKGSPAYAPEPMLQFFVTKAAPAAGALLGDGADPAITLMGSSYSNAWTRFPEALRYTLQRDILAISVGADQGSWVGMESYLRDDAFQTKKPKLLIWEMPERDMRAPPNFKYRDTRYQSDNTEWLLRAAAWVQNACAPSAATGKLVAGGLASAPAASVTAGATTDADFIELSFEKPLEKLDYLSASVATTGSKSLVLEASGAGVETRKFTVPVAGDGAAHALRAPLPSAGKGFTKLRIFPGKSSAFAFKDVQVCRLPEDLLK